MPIELQLEVIFFSISLIMLILLFVRKEMMSIKYSLVWLFSTVLMLLSALVPDIMENIAKGLGFKVLSNMVFTLIILILMFVSISHTIIASRQNEKIRLLIQEVSILKSKQNEGK